MAKKPLPPKTETNPDKKVTAPNEVVVTDKDGSQHSVDVAQLGVVEVTLAKAEPAGVQTPERGVDYGEGGGLDGIVRRHVTEIQFGSLVDETGMRLLGTDGWHPFRADKRGKSKTGHWTKVVNWRRFLVDNATYHRVNS
jgi:hypothetical protein